MLSVFVIRIAERRIDSVLDAAMLDYETLEDFNDVRFEGEWTLFRSLGKMKQRGTILPKASSVFATAHAAGGAVTDTTATPGRFGSLRDTIANRSPAYTSGRPHAELDHMSSASSRSNSAESLAIVAATGLTVELSPLSITEMLSGVLLVLQLYEVNPVMIVQAFSQIFFWIASELFNRILTRKKYLCRTKAVQIRMNITVLEDWVRTNGLPAKTATKHLEPVTQLLQWLQCLSHIKDFDSLIGTMQNMKAINPLQMRRAVREYRFEVNEGKMTDECAQYLAQLQKDWERRRVGISAKAGQEMPGRIAAIDDVVDISTPVDALFDGTTLLADFVPHSAPECFGELIDSRFMLPFLLPKANAYLIATPPANAAFQSVSPHSPFLSDGSRASRPPSRSSYSSSRPMGWAIPSQRKLRELPSDFFTWLKDRKSELRHHRGIAQPKKKGLLQSTDVSKPSGQKVAHPLQLFSGSSVTRKMGTVPSLDEDDRTPTTKPSDGYRFPNSGLQTSVSLDKMRDQARVPFEAVDKPVALHSDTYELKIRSAGSLRQPALSGQISTTSFQPPASPHYELARHRRESVMSVTSPKSAGSPVTSPKSLLSPLMSPSSLGSNSGKNWWKLARQKSSDNLGRRKASEASEDNLASGVGYEEMRKAVVGKVGTA